jgi:hypothetical protein
MSHSIGMAVFAAVLSFGITGCEKHEAEGPAEQAGKELDKAMEKAGEEIEQMGKDIQKSVEEQNRDEQRL